MIQKVSLLLSVSVLLSAVAFGSDTIITIAGTGAAGSAGDSGPATAATLTNPAGIAIDKSGNIYFADTGSHSVRRIDTTTNVITTFAGTGTAGFSGDSGAANAAQLNMPSAVAFDSTGNLYIADTGNNRIREVANATENISTIAGISSAGSSGDNGLAASAALSGPMGMGVDSSNNIFIADTGNNRIRKIDGVTNIIQTICGSTSGFAGDNGPAINGQLNAPVGLVFDPVGNLYIADQKNNAVRKIDTAANLSTVAGNPNATSLGDGGPATSASLNGPSAVGFDATQNFIYIADTGNNRIRKVDTTTQLISTAAGAGTAGISGDGGDATLAQLASPAGITVDSSKNYYISDTGNHRIRKAGSTLTSNISITGGISALPNPVRTTIPSVGISVPVKFSIQATDSSGSQPQFTWDFGDGATATGATPSHPYANDGTFTVSVIISDATQSVSATTTVTAFGPNANADLTFHNVSTMSIPLMNPVDGTTTSVPDGIGGVVEFVPSASSATASQTAVRATTSIATSFTADPLGANLIGARSSLSGIAAYNRFGGVGLTIALTTVTDGSGNPVGKMRKTIAISNREIGMPALSNPSDHTIGAIKLSGKFSFANAKSKSLDRAVSNKPDQVTFSGSIELPAGLNISDNQPMSVGIGNIIDTVTITPKGVSTGPGVNSLVTKVKVKYPHLPKGSSTLPVGQRATISFTLSQTGLSEKGFDTEGVTSLNTKAMGKTGTQLTIQSVIMFAGESYETDLTQVLFKLTSNQEAGSIGGRSH